MRHSMNRAPRALRIVFRVLLAGCVASMMAVALGGVEHLQPIEAAPGDLPDLQSLAISAQSETAVEGDPFWVEVRVSNGGAGPAGPSHAHLFLSIDDDWDVTDDYSVGEQPVEALEPGAEVQVRWDFTMPDLGTPPYTVWPVVVLDADNEVAESDENNTWKRTNAIQVSDTGEGEGGLPDLQVSAINIPAETATEGTSFWVESVIVNNGGSPAQASFARLYLSTDGDHDVSNDYSVGEQPVDLLSAHASQTVRWEFKMPDLGAGTYTVWAITVVDSRGQIEESDESNVWKRDAGIQVTDGITETYAWGDLASPDGATPVVACNGSPGGQDAALILKSYAGLIDALKSCPVGATYAAPDFPPGSDVNGDAKLGGQDAALVLRYYAGLIDCFPVDVDCNGTGPETMP